MGKKFVDTKDSQLEHLREKALYIARVAGKESSAIQKERYSYSYDPLGRRHAIVFEYDGLRIELHEPRMADDKSYGVDSAVHIFIKQPNRIIPLFKPYKSTYSWSRNSGINFNGLPPITQTVTDDTELRFYMSQEINRLYRTFRTLKEEKKMTDEQIRAIPREEFEKIANRYYLNIKK